MAYTFFNTELYSMPATSLLTEVLMNELASLRAMVQALSVRDNNGQIGKTFQSHFFRMAGTCQLQQYSLTGTPYSLVKYSETIKLSSGQYL